MKWITRTRPKTDRIACPWLITRFIDHDAEIVYVPADTVIEHARQLGGRSFDTGPVGSSITSGLLPARSNDAQCRHGIDQEFQPRPLNRL